MAVRHASCPPELVITELVAAGDDNDDDVDSNAGGGDMVDKSG